MRGAARLNSEEANVGGSGGVGSRIAPAHRAMAGVDRSTATMGGITRGLP